MLRASPDLDTLVLSTKQQSSQTQQDVAFAHSNTTEGSHGNLPLTQAAMRCYNYESTWTQHNFNLMVILNTCNIHKVKINFFLIYYFRMLSLLTWYSCSSITMDIFYHPKIEQIHLNKSVNSILIVCSGFTHWLSDLTGGDPLDPSDTWHSNGT